ncbi:MAG: hypothetical protein NTZ87_01480 [Candidatus Nomurabacteria bacterium]|nr:hypothetical protein [Candidatus Nomurabacteria bacterium]
MKKINLWVSLVLYVIAIFIIYWWFHVNYGYLGNISPFWVSLILGVAGLYFAFRGKKLNESKQLSHVLITIEIVLLVIASLYFILLSGL